MVNSFFVQFWAVVAFVLGSLVCATVYWRYETHRPVSTGTNNRDDDSVAMQGVWTVVWLASTLTFLPIARTLLGGVDCTLRAGGMCVRYGTVVLLPGGSAAQGPCVGG